MEVDNDYEEEKMATLIKAIHTSSTMMNSLSKLFSTLTLNSNINILCNAIHVKRIPATLSLMQNALLHTAPVHNGLMEFFDAEKNWEKTSVPVGRSWKTEELRRKSNEDLHKLWYVLLKERNMLMTMDEIYKRDNLQFPSPDRIDKVEISMKNLEKVVRERNRAYFMLETGESGERPAKMVYNPLGLKMHYRLRQYCRPKHQNRKWHETHQFGFGGYAVAKFRRLYREKIWNAKRRERNRQQNHALTTMRVFPNVDMEALAKKYPLANVKKLQESKKAQSHSVPPHLC